VNQEQLVSTGSVVALLDMMAGPEKTPSRTAARSEAVRAVEDALEQLPTDYRQAVRLVYLEGLTASEAGERMHRTERGVHNLCYKAKKHLRDLLGSRSHYLSNG
jgi:RNA polymerase sigma-70 factor (ECF subfamily)